MEDKGAVKNDDGKLRFDLIPVESLKRLAEVYTIGARKYSDRNWEKGLKWGRVYSALQRHATAWWGGEQNDPVDGQHHLASVAWAAFALMEYERTHRELDDRNKNIHIPCSIIPVIDKKDRENKLKNNSTERQLTDLKDIFSKLKQGTDPSDEDVIDKISGTVDIPYPYQTGEFGGV